MSDCDTLTAALEAVLDRRGSAVAVIDGGRAGRPAVTFEALAAESEAMASVLADVGIRRGDVVLNWLPNVREWLALQFAAARLGVLSVPMNTRFREHELTDTIEATDAAALVLPAGFLGIDFAGITRRVLGGDGLPAANQRWPSLRALFTVDCSPDGDASSPELAGATDLGAAVAAAEGRTVPAAGHPDDAADAFTTSGTTNKPKLAVHSQRAIVTHSRNVALPFELDRDARMLAALPLCGVFGFTGYMATLLAGGAVVLQPVFAADEAVVLFADHGVTHCYGPDTMLRAIIEAAPDPSSALGSWRVAAYANFSGDGPAVAALAEERVGVRPRGLYGSSECFALMSVWPNDAPPDLRRAGGGYPVSDAIEVRAADPESGELLDHEQPGELQIRGYNVMVGYLRNDEATKRAFTDDGWFRTGDFGNTRGDGSFVYLARLGDSLRLGGFLVDPREIEEQFTTHPGVRTAAVVGVTRPGKGDIAVGFVQLEAGAGVTAEELRAYCRDRVAAFKVPEAIVVVDEFPMVEGPNGVKIQRNRLRKLAEEQVGAHG